MPTDSLLITDTNPITLPPGTPSATPHRIPFEGVPEVTGSAGLSLADDINGDQTQIVLPDDESWAIYVDLVVTSRRAEGDLPADQSVGRVEATSHFGMTTGAYAGAPIYYGERVRVSFWAVVPQPPNVEDPMVAVWPYGGSGVGGIEILERTLTVFPRGPARTYARYTGSTAQGIPRDRDTLVAFPTESVFHHLISRTAQGDGHRFTFLGGGVWAVTATTRFVAGGGAGERYSALVSDNYGSPQVITAGGGYNGSAPETTNLSYTGYFPEGSYIEASVWQNGSNSLDLEGSPIWKNITFALIEGDA